MFDFIAPVIDPGSELAEVLDAILRDLSQVVDYEHVRILLLPSVLDVRGASNTVDDDDRLITVRDLGPLAPVLASTAPLPLDKYPLNRLLMTMQKPIVISDTRYSDLWVKANTHTNIRAWIGAPLVVKGESIGVLTLHSSAPMKYTDRDGLVVFAFASLAAEAIDKVRLLDQAQNRLHAMMSLYDASLDVIGQTQNLDSLLQTLVRRAVELLGASAGAMYLVEPDRQTLRVAITYGFADDFIGGTLMSGDGLGGRVYQSGEPLIVDDYQRWSGRSAKYDAEPRLSAVIGVPLRWKKDVLGVLEIFSDSPMRRFNTQDRWLAELFANQVAIAMGNARLAEQGRRHLAELAAMRDIGQHMNSTLDIDKVLDVCCAHVLSLSDANFVYLCVCDEACQAYEPALTRRRVTPPQALIAPAVLDGLIDRVRSTGQVVIVDDAVTPEIFSAADTRAMGMRTIAGFPLNRGRCNLGAFAVAFDTLHHFSEDDLRMLTLLADQAAFALDYALVFHDLQSAQAAVADPSSATP